jgi:hypothetical protein
LPALPWSSPSTSSAPATLLRGPITHLRVISRSTLCPGVIFTHYRSRVRGYRRAQEIYRISWAIGDTHVKLGSALLGTYHPAQETVDVHPVHQHRQSSLILIGARGGSGLTMLSFARVLRQLGAQQAIGFDNNGSAEMYRPGHRPYTAYGYERWLPTATALRYR